MVDAELRSPVGTLRRVHAGIFHNQKAGASFCALLVIIDVKKTHLTILFPIVRAHGRHDHSVLQCHMFDGKRFKNVFVFTFHKKIPP